MARVQTKQAKQQQMNYGFPDLPFDDRDEPENKTEVFDPQTAYAALQGQIAALQNQLSSYGQDRVAAITTPAVTVQPQFDTEFKTDGLPDPTLDPEKYAVELNNRINKIADAKLAKRDYEASQQAAAEARYNALWEQFASQHKEYAGDPKKVEFAATKVVQAVAAQGLDPNRYMASSKFFQDVVSEMDSTFGKPQTEEQDDDPGQQQQIPEDTGRTEAMFGGVVQGNAPIIHKDEGSDDMMADIRAFQQKHGFHR